MTLTFFYLVQDTGSWLEIGQSITFFCVSSLLLLWSGGVCVAGEYLMSDVIHLNMQFEFVGSGMEEEKKNATSFLEVSANG
jgi:hypothetical protein